MSDVVRDLSRAGEGGSEFLGRLGDRVRDERARRGMTRKLLAHASGVSERYLAQLEAGHGNISVLLLRQLARALALPVEGLVREGPEPTLELTAACEFLRRLPPDELAEARRLLGARFGVAGEEQRRRHIALIGLRGAGKSTLGKRLAEHLDVPFLELDREIERSSGLSLAEIFDLYGQGAFRRYERQTLDRLLATHPRFVLAAGGSIVSEASTFAELLASCYTVWVKATPQEHMERVVAQGDLRPMADNREAMSDLERILAGREALYGKADVDVDTAGRSVEDAFDALLGAVTGSSPASTPPP
jgi:XRE family aerobic/anaerobic benzoate catabolism transcriptional regulator